MKPRSFLKTLNRSDGAIRFDAARRRIASAIGAVALGLAAIAFAALGDLSQRAFAALAARWPYAALVITPAVFAGVVHLTRRYRPEASGSGIPQVIAATRSPASMADRPLLSLRTAGSKLAMTLAILLAGGSVGREGPTVQVSAAIMVALHRLLRVPITAGVLIAGGAAGVAAAFNTPLAGVAFAIGELASAYEQRIAVLVMAAVMISGLVGLGIAGDYIYFGAMRDTLSVGSVLVAAPVAGIVGGLAGGLFSRILIAFAGPAKGWLVVFKARPIAAAALLGLIVAAIGIATRGATWGTVFVTPSRWMTGGKNLDTFRERMPTDKHLLKVVDFPKLYEAFPRVKIRGGVAYFLWDREYEGPCEVQTIWDGQPTGPAVSRHLDAYDILVRRNEGVPILEKVKSRGEHTLDTCASSRPLPKPDALTDEINALATWADNLRQRQNAARLP